MKKALTLAVVACIALGMSACSAADAPGGTPQVLMWVDATREAAANQYKEAVAGSVDVTVEVIDAAQLQTKIILANQTGSGWPDVVFAGGSDMATLTDPADPYALALDDYVDASVVSGFGNTLDTCTIDGKLYCLQNDLAQTVLWYDTQTFAQRGLTVPTTMDEFAATAMSLQGSGYVAGAVGDQGFYAGFLASSGCPMAEVKDATTVVIDPSDVACTRVADLTQPLVDAGVLDRRSSFDAGFISDVAQQGKVAMYIGPSWWGDAVMKPAESWAIPAGRIATAPMPSWDGSDENYSGYWGGGVFVASSHSQYPQAAADAVVYMTTSGDVQTEAPTFPAYGPANEAWSTRISSDTYYAQDIVPALVEQAGKISPVNRPVRFAFNTEIGATLASAITAGSSIQDAIDAFAASLTQLAQGSGYTVE